MRPDDGCRGRARVRGRPAPPGRSSRGCRARPGAAAAGTPLPRITLQRRDRPDTVPRRASSLERRRRPARVRGGIERRDVTFRHGLNEGALLLVGMRPGEGHCLLDRSVGPRRLLRRHSTVDIRSPGPGFSPIADRAVRIAAAALPETIGPPLAWQTRTSDENPG